MFSEIPNWVLSLLFSSILAIFLFWLRIRLQSIPSTYDAKRRIKDRFLKPNGKFYFNHNDNKYYINEIFVSKEKGLHNRIEELYTGNRCGRTQIIFSPNGEIPESVETNQIKVINLNNSKVGFFYETDTTVPKNIHSELLSNVKRELEEM